jgi:hypothetical protein
MSSRKPSFSAENPGDTHRRNLLPSVKQKHNIFLAFLMAKAI